MRSEPLFKPGDVAVLKNVNGGRMFEVYSVDGERVTEKAWAEHQQPYALEVWCDQLIPVADRQAAGRLVASLTKVREKYDVEKGLLDAARYRDYLTLYEFYRRRD